MSNMREKTSGYVTGSSNNGQVSMAAGRYVLAMVLTTASAATSLPAITLSGSATTLSILQTTPSTGVGGSAVTSLPQAGVTCTSSGALYVINATGSWGWSFGTCTIGAISTYDLMLIPFGFGLSLADSRKAVDWDPIAVLSRKLQELEMRLPTLHEEEKYCDSHCSTPLHVEPDLTQSTQDLATSLFSRLRLGESAVTRKTAHVQAA